MLDQLRSSRSGVALLWGPRALAEASACRRDDDARTAITLVVPDPAGGLPTAGDVTALRKVGLVAIDVPGDVDFAAPGGDLAAARFVCLLRDCTGLGVPVLWGGTGADMATVTALWHLRPPCRPLAGLAADVVAAWRRSYRPGCFCWRRGPGFMVVDDRRAGGPARRVVFGDPYLIDAFEQLAAPVREAGGSARRRAAIRHLVTGGLTVRVGPWLLHAPHRLGP